MRRRVGAVVVSVVALGGGALAVALPDSHGGAHAGATHRALPPRHRAPHAGAAHRARPPRHRDPIETRVDVLKTLPASESRCQKAPPPVPEHPISHRRWLTGVTITEYYPAPERWFTGRRIRAPGLRGRYAADFLYSARGVAMEGDGVDRRGRRIHISALGSTGWVDASGRSTVPVCLGNWTNGFPVWLLGGWRNGAGTVTFPLASGGWANGRGGRVRDYGGVAFSAGPSKPLRYYHSIAVDPRLIPMGSRVYVPAYHHLGGGWFIAGDTGGAIKGRHIDVYRPPPASPSDLGRYMTRQRILVIPPR